MQPCDCPVFVEGDRCLSIRGDCIVSRVNTGIAPGPRSTRVGRPAVERARPLGATAPQQLQLGKHPGGPNAKGIAHHRRLHQRNHRPSPTAAERSLKTQDHSQSSSDQGSLGATRVVSRGDSASAFSIRCLDVRPSSTRSSTWIYPGCHFRCALHAFGLPAWVPSPRRGIQERSATRS